MESEPGILDSAYRHGVTDAVMLQALRFPCPLFRAQRLDDHVHRPR